LRKNLLNIITIVFIVTSILQAQETARPVNGDRLKIGFVIIQVPVFNPLVIRTEYEREINRLIFGDGLSSREKDGHIVNGLAFSIDREQNTVYRVNLRSNIFFHDGSPITAGDVKFSFDLYKKFALQSNHTFEMRLVSTVNIIDDKTLRIILKEPLKDFRETIGLLPILPKKHYENWMNFNLLSRLPYIFPQGNGHYMFSRQIGNRIELEAFTRHYRGRSYLDGIDILFFRTYEKMVEAFINGQIDLIPIEDTPTARKIRRLSPSTKIETVAREEIKIYYILLNTRTSPFNDLSIRRAINYGIFKNQLVDKLIGKDGRVALNIIEENSDYYFPGVPVYRYDPLKSLDILKDAGFRQRDNGKLFQNNRELKFEFLFRAGSSFEESIARMISINLAELGINMIPRPREPEELENMVKEGRYQAALRQYVYNPNHPVQSIRAFYLSELKSENGFKNFDDRAMNTAVTQINNIPENQQTAMIVQQMQVHLNQQSPCIYLFYQDIASYAISDRFENTKNTLFQKLEYVGKINPKNEWFVPKQKQKN
jgi:peptide/nickel transport system substrate-binding protein